MTRVTRARNLSPCYLLVRRRAVLRKQKKATHDKGSPFSARYPFSPVLDPLLFSQKRFIDEISPSFCEENMGYRVSSKCQLRMENQLRLLELIHSAEKN